MSHPTVEAGDALPLMFPKLLRERAERLGGKAFVVVDDASLSYRDADLRSRELARALLAAGAGKGSHVGTLLPSGADLLLACFAAMRIGAVAVPFSTFSKPRELTELLANADVDLLLATRAHRSHDYEKTLAAAIPGLDLAGPGLLHCSSLPTLRGLHFDAPSEGVHPDWSLDRLLAGARDVDDDVLVAAEGEVAPSDRLVVIHTSGSTSAPKGVVHLHGALLRHVDNLNESRGYTESEVLFSNSPWFWIGGFAYTMLGTLLAGATLVTSNAAEASAVLDLLERERPTMVNGFAASVAHLPRDPSFARRDLSSIRRGNLWPILPEGIRPKDPGLRHAMLGTTETGSVCLDAPHEDELPEHQRGSFGRPAVGFEARIVDPERGAICAPGAVGTLHLRGPFLMEGYYGKERSEAFDADGWYDTGDLFHVDEAGLHYFHGRARDLIKSAGANVSPREVEAVIADVSGLRAHVVGLPDAARGQRVAAAIVSDAPVDVGALEASLRERLSSYKVPATFLVLAEQEVPMMSSGKLDARALRECFPR